MKIEAQKLKSIADDELRSRRWGHEGMSNNGNRWMNDDSNRGRLGIFVKFGKKNSLSCFREKEWENN